MKAKLFTSLALVAFLLTTMTCYSQDKSGIKFKFKNNSIFPKKLTLISYTPGDSGNGTQGFWMWPGGTRDFSFREGTKLYIANQKQVDRVMGGNRIDNQKPFLVVTKETTNQMYKF
jgi:hypothetical protein